MPGDEIENCLRRLMRVERARGGGLFDDSSVRKRQNGAALRVVVEVRDELLEVGGGGCRVGFKNGNSCENFSSCC